MVFDLVLATFLLVGDVGETGEKPSSGACVKALQSVDLISIALEFQSLIALINLRLTQSYGLESGTTPNRLYAAMKQAVLAGGKRIRGLMILLAAKDLGLAEESMMPMALAIEELHAASLILDDLPSQDDAKLRRGVPSLHLQFDVPTAELAAISLLMKGLDLNALGAPFGFEKTLRIQNYWMKLIGHRGLSLGQWMDLHPEDNPKDVATIEKMIDLKTGRGIEASLWPIFYLAGAPEEKLEKVKELANKMGRLFQISDDLLDVEGSQKQTGKDSGTDKANGRVNLVSLLGVAEAKIYRDRLVAELHVNARELLPNSKNFPILIELIWKRNS